MSEMNEAIHEVGRKLADEGWKACIDGLDARALARVIDYRMIQYNHIYDAAQVRIVRKKLVEAAALYRTQQYEKAADLFYLALTEVGIIEDPEDEG